MKKLKLVVEKRKVFGKKVKKLRKEGIFPANIYGKDVKSLAVQLPYKEFENVFKEARETGLVDLQIDSQVRPVLIHNVQLDYLTQTPVHADFYQVNLKEKVKTMVPLVLTGEAKAVSDKIGIVLQPLSEVEIEALPTDLPENIEVNVEHLAQIDEQITVDSLKVPAGVTILTDKEQVVVKIGELISKEAQEQAAAEAAAAEAAKAEAVPAPIEGAAPTEGAPTTETEKKAEEGKPATTQVQKGTETSKEQAPLRQGSAGQARPASNAAKAGAKPQEKKI